MRRLTDSELTSMPTPQLESLLDKVHDAYEKAIERSEKLELSSFITDIETAIALKER